MAVRYLILLCVLFLLAAPCSAAEPELSSSPGFRLTPATNISKDLRVFTTMEYVADADFTNNLGSVQVMRTGLGADYSIFRLTYDLSYFAWTHKERVGRTLKTGGATTPWDTLHDVTLQARLLNNTLGNDWRYWVNGEVASSFEELFPGAVGVGFDGGVAYDLWNGWMIGVSAKTIALSALSADLFGDVEFGVAITTSQKTLRNTLRSLGLFTDSPEGYDEIGFSIAFSSAEKTYRLASHSPLYNNGYLGVVRNKIGAYLDYLPNEAISVSVGPEFHYQRKYRLYNSAGVHQSSHNLDNAFGGFARFQWKF